jgi:hypothetical protein
MARIEAAQFHYLAPLKRYSQEKPYLSRLPFLPIMKRTNISRLQCPLTVYNLSGHENLFTLDVSGFEFRKMPFKATLWSDRVAIDSYVPAVKSWLLDIFGGSVVYIYAFNVCPYPRYPSPGVYSLTTGKVSWRSL